MPMPRGNGASESSLRSSSRPPLQLKNIAAEPEGVQTLRCSVERSPKFSCDRRSPRRCSTVSEKKPCLNGDLQKKRNCTISALQTELDQAQNEVKRLKEQLASAENAKKEVELELEETKKQIGTPQGSLPDDDLADGSPEPPETPPIKEEKSISMEPDEGILMEASLEKSDEEKPEAFIIETSKKSEDFINETSKESEVPMIDTSKESEVSITDVVSTEVTVDKSVVESITELSETKPEHSVQESGGEAIESLVTETENASQDPIVAVGIDELPPEKLIDHHQPTESMEEVKDLKVKLLETNQKLIRLSEENEFLRLCLLDAEELKAKDAEMSKRLNQVTEELQESNKRRGQVTEQLEVVIQAKAELEAEMKRVKVQTEQWRKAAEAAAAIVASTDRDMEMTGRSRSANKYAGSDYLAPDLMEDGNSAKRNGSSGKKRFGDLWKKK